MTLLVFALVIASAFLHALWNALLKRQPDPEQAVSAVIGVSAGSAVVVALVAGRGFPSLPPAGWTVLAGVFEAGYFVTLAQALARAPLGAVYTIARGGALVAVWPASALWLGEVVTATGVAGTVMVGVGLALVGTGGKRVGGRGSRVERSGLLYAAACALFIAAYHLCYKRALSTGGPPPSVVALSLSTAFLVNAAARWKPPTLRGTRPIMLVVTGLLSTASFTLFLFALERSGAGIMLTLRNTSVLFAQVLALMMGERPGRPQLVGVVLVAAGAIVLGWPAGTR